MANRADESRLTLPVSEERDHILGKNPNAIVLVEYGDYECPYCAQAHAAMPQVLAHFGDDLRLVFRNFPLAQMHAHAQKAAEAAEAAGAQGRFWEMHALLYEHQDALDDDGILSLAKRAGLDLKRFADELARDVYAARVREDFLSGVRSGVNGTPNFFLDGRRVDLPLKPAALIASLEAETKQRRSKRPK